MSHQYKVIARPFYTYRGARHLDINYHVGDTVLSDMVADSDGDVHVAGPRGGARISATCLTPVAPDNDIERVSVNAVRAVLALAGMTGPDLETVLSNMKTIDTAYLN